MRVEVTLYPPTGAKELEETPQTYSLKSWVTYLVMGLFVQLDFVAKYLFAGRNMDSTPDANTSLKGDRNWL